MPSSGVGALFSAPRVAVLSIVQKAPSVSGSEMGTVPRVDTSGARAKVGAAASAVDGGSGALPT